MSAETKEDLRISEFSFEVKSKVQIKIPGLIRILKVGVKNNWGTDKASPACIWAIIDANKKETMDVEFTIVRTGQPIDVDESYAYLGSFLQQKPIHQRAAHWSFVRYESWHVFVPQRYCWFGAQVG